MYRFRPCLNLTLLFAILTFAACGGKSAGQHVADARESLAENEPRVAVVELKNAIQKDPALGEAHALLGRIRFNEGDMTNAGKDLTRALDLGVTDDETRLTLMNVKLSMGGYSEVIGELEDQPGLAPEYQVMLGDAYLLAQDPDLAKPLFQNNLHLADGLLGMSKVAFLENDSNRALKYALQAVEKDPQNASAWLFKGEVELTTGDTEAALASFTSAQQVPAADVNGRLGKVRTHLIANDLELARSEVEALIGKMKNLPQAHYLMAVISYRQDDLDAAEKALDVVDRYANDNLQATYLMGVVKYRQGRLHQANSVLRRYLKQDITNVSVRKLLASIANDLGRPEDVVDLLQAVAPQHSDPQMWAMLGSALLRLGKTETATEALETAVSLAPDMASFRNQLALGLLSSGQDQRAIAELDSAIELGGEQLQSDYLLIMVKTRDGDFSGANEAVDALLAKSPDNAVAHNLKGSVAMAAGNPDLARESFMTANRLDPAFFPAVQNLARLAEADGNPDAAQQLLMPLSEAGNERAALALVDLAVRRQQFDQALGLIAAAVKKFPESVPAHMGSARLLMATGELRRAEDAVDQARALAGEVPEVLLLKAEISLRQGNRGDAVSVVRKLQSLVSRNDQNANVLAAVGALQLRVDNLTGARRNLQRALDVADEPVIPALVNLVRLELLEDNPAQAQQLLEQLRKLNVGSEEIDLLQGDTLVAAQRMDAAREHFGRMAEQGSRAGTSKVALLDLQAGNYAAVEDRLSAWLQQHPKDAAMQRLLASAQVQLGQSDAAKAQYEAMLPTTDPVVLNNLAWIYMTEDDPRAIELARKANSAAPKNPDIEDTLGWILVNLGELEEGLDYLRSSARVRPDNASVQFHLGVAYMKMGEHENAIRALEKALTIGDFNEVREARKMLEQLSSS